MLCAAGKMELKLKRRVEYAEDENNEECLPKRAVGNQWNEPIESGLKLQGRTAQAH